MILNNDAYVEHAWHGTLLSWSVVAVGVFINTVIAGVLPFLEGVILILHTLGFICILIPLVYLSPTHASASDVFFSALNEGNWPTQGLSFCIGFIGNVGTFVGADAAVHVSLLAVSKTKLTRHRWPKKLTTPLPTCHEQSS